MKPSNITKNELETAGWQCRILNGIMPEYYREYAPDSTWEPSRWRLCVRFNELRGEPEDGRPYLYAGNTILPLFAIKTLEQLEQLFSLLAFDEWERAP